MKNLFFLLTFSILTYSSIAQTQKTDVYDAVKNLIPDSTEQKQTGNWNSLPKNNAAFKWSQVDCAGTSCILNGEVVLLPNKHFEGSEKGIACLLYLDGIKEGYKSFEISTGWDVFYKGDMVNPIKLLFDKHPYKATFYKKCNKPSLSYSYVIYKLELPGKKPIWLQFLIGTDEKGNTRTFFRGYLSLKSVDISCG